MEKHNYRLSIEGCDDSTNFDIELTDQEFVLMQNICAKAKETSTYGCMPTMEIKKLPPEKEITPRDILEDFAKFNPNL